MVLINSYRFASQSSYLVQEDCEGVGTPSGWTDGIGANWDYTANPIVGSQSLFLTANGSGGLGNITSVSFTPSGTGNLWVYLIVRIEVVPSSTTGDWFQLSGAADADPRFSIRTNATTASFTSAINGTSSTTFGNSHVAGEIVHLWVNLNAVGSYIYLSSDGIRPGSPTQSRAPISNVGLVEKLRFLGNRGANMTFDKIRVSSSEIFSNPA